MTVSSTVLRNDYTGNGVTTAFTGSFRILDQTHIQVLRTQISTGIATTLALTTDYTVSGVGGSSFTVTCLTAPTSDQRLTILRNVPLTQLTDYVANDPFPAESHEQALDKLTMIAQQLQEAQGRALSLSANSVGVSATLPSAEPAKILGWAGTGTELANYDAASLAGSVATINWTHDTFSGTGAQTAFTLTSAPGSADNCDVSISGATQRSGTDYSVSGVTLTFTSAPPLGTDNIFVRYGSQLAAGVPGDGTVTAAKLSSTAIPGTIAAATSKTTPVDADLLGLVDSAASNALKKLTWANLKATLKTYFDTLYTSYTAPANSQVRLSTANGYGSTATKIKRYSTVIENTGSNITYADSATNGASWTINVSGRYSISVTASASATSYYGISRNSNQLTTSIQSITDSHILNIAKTIGGDHDSVSWVGYLTAGDVIRAHTEGSATSGAGPERVTVSRIA